MGGFWDKVGVGELVEKGGISRGEPLQMGGLEEEAAAAPEALLTGAELAEDAEAPAGTGRAALIAAPGDPTAAVRLIAYVAAGCGIADNGGFEAVVGVVAVGLMQGPLCFHGRCHSQIVEVVAMDPQTQTRRPHLQRALEGEEP